MYELTVKSRFSAAHRLKNYPGNCERVHGHNWTVEVKVRSSKLDDVGLAMDFRDIKSCLNEILDELDHRDLNDIEPFKSLNPSSELIAKHIYEALQANLPGENRAAVHSVTVWESDDCAATFFKGN